MSGSGPARLDRKLSQGRRLFNVEMKIVDEHGKRLPHDGEARGELLTDPPQTEDRYEDVKSILIDLNRRLEDRVREHPEQYFWMHRRWKNLGIHAPRPKKKEGA